ncbi:B-cell receptor CD22-like isoform X2 [Festucalex cinctus]
MPMCTASTNNMAVSGKELLVAYALSILAMHFYGRFCYELTAVVEPSTVTEGKSVRLTCRSECGNHVHIWYRDGKVVPEPVFLANRKDSGMYYCAVLGQQWIRSVSVALNVQYAPSNVVLSITPAGNVVNGSSVTLNCSSDANPPVPPQSGYSLYKGDQLISTGPSHTISLLQPSHGGLYRCEASNNISLRGNTFVKSTELSLDVQYLPSAADGSSVKVMCSGTANPATHSYVWYKWTSSSSLLQVGSGQVLSLSSMETPHTGIYLCQARSQLEVINSTKVLVAMEEQNSGRLSVPILGGLGACIFSILVIALFFLWIKQRKTKKKAMFPFQEVSSAATEDQSNNIYANFNMHTPSPQPPPRTYSKKQHSNAMHTYGHVKTRRQRSRPRSQNNNFAISNNDEVTYSTVTIDVKKSHYDQNRSQESRFKMGQTADSVIYSTVANYS